MLVVVLVQLFSIHLHFKHEGQSHDVYVHSSLSTDHNLVEEGESDHGEEGDLDFMGSFGKQFSPFNLLLIFSYVLMLPILTQLRLVVVDVHRLYWHYQLFFYPPLRAPPL